MKAGIAISAAGHGLLIAFVLFGGAFEPEDLPPPEVANVSIMSEEEFAALSGPETAPEVSEEPPAPEQPASEDETGAPGTPEPDRPPDVTSPDEAAPPEAPDDTPVPPEPLAPEAEVPDTAPEAPAPPPADEGPETDSPPVERSAPRIAPEAAPPPPPDVDSAPEVVERTTPEPAEEATPEPDEPASAPEEAATEIVTEADRPSTAPERSVRPAARPDRPAPRVAEETTDETDSPAEAPGNQASAAEDAAQDIPRGPPMTGAETDAFRIAVARCWNVDSGSEAAQVTVTVGFTLTREGEVEGDVRRLSASEGSAAAQNAAFEAARRAILRCGASGYDLPEEKYGQWREVEITFDPKEMRLR